MLLFRYNNVNKGITIFIFDDYLSSYYESQVQHLYDISAFKNSLYYLIKVCVFFFLVFLVFFFFEKKGFFPYMKNTFPLPSPSYA